MTRLRNHFDRELILLLIFSAFAVAALLSPGFFFARTMRITRSFT